MIGVDGPPIVPPPAGAWIRTRKHPRTDRRRPAFLGPASPRWVGAWHLATGDMDWPGYALARCGRRVLLRIYRPPASGLSRFDHVVADDQPGVDTCGACWRLTTGEVAA